MFILIRSMTDLLREKLERWLDDNFFKVAAVHQLKKTVDLLRPHLQGSMLETLQVSAEAFSIKDLRALIVDEFIRQAAEHSSDHPFQDLLAFAVTEARNDLLFLAINPDDPEAEELVHDIFAPFDLLLLKEQVRELEKIDSDKEARVLPFDLGRKR